MTLGEWNEIFHSISRRQAVQYIVEVELASLRPGAVVGVWVVFVYLLFPVQVSKRVGKLQLWGAMDVLAPIRQPVFLGNVLLCIARRLVFVKTVDGISVFRVAVDLEPAHML